MSQATLNSQSLSQSVLQPAGRLGQDYDALWAAFLRQSYVPLATLELCRLRLAQLHRASAEYTARAPGVSLDSARVDSLLQGRWEQDSGFSAAEKAALEYTELYGIDPESISDAAAANVVEHFGEPGLVCLTEALGVIDGRIRLALMFAAWAAATH
jgi:hypothetical protein